MIRYEQLKQRPAIFQSFTGLKLAAFAKLLVSFGAAYEADLAQRDRQQPRVRQRGGGRSGALATLEDKLLFILVYFRYYPVQVLQGYLFGLSQPQAYAWIQRLTPLLNAALGREQQLPARTTQAIASILRRCPDLEFIIDGTERPVRRPKDREQQQANYSGKKKRHTVKNNVVSDKRSGKIKGLSSTVAGKKHDKALADEQDLRFPPGSKLWKDTGFQGYEPENTLTYQPQKKPKGRELTPAETTENQRIARERIGIEHSLAGVKVFAIVHETFRNLKAGFVDLVLETACGLHNLRRDYPMTA